MSDQLVFINIDDKFKLLFNEKLEKNKIKDEINENLEYSDLNNIEKWEKEIDSLKSFIFDIFKLSNKKIIDINYLEHIVYIDYSYQNNLNIKFYNELKKLKKIEQNYKNELNKKKSDFVELTEKLDNLNDEIDDYDIKYKKDLLKFEKLYQKEKEFFEILEKSSNNKEYILEKFKIKENEFIKIFYI